MTLLSIGVPDWDNSRQVIIEEIRNKYNPLKVTAEQVKKAIAEFYDKNKTGTNQPKKIYIEDAAGNPVNPFLPDWIVVLNLFKKVAPLFKTEQENKAGSFYKISIKIRHPEKTNYSSYALVFKLILGENQKKQIDNTLLGNGDNFKIEKVIEQKKLF